MPKGSRSGVYVGINNWRTLKPTELSFYMMQMAIELESPIPSKQRLAQIYSTSMWEALSGGQN